MEDASGITTDIAITLFASSLGRWVDHAPSRLRTLLTTVSVNRIVVVAACLCWALIIGNDARTSAPLSKDPNAPKLDARPLAVTQFTDVVFLAILALGIIERLSRLANLVSIERDWVPTLANNHAGEKQEVRYDLTHLNAVMSRIDLVCKLGSPIMFSMFMASTKSPRLGAVALISLNLVTWPLEYWTARTVWSRVDRLQVPRIVSLASAKQACTTADSPGEDEKHDGFVHFFCWRQSLKAVEALSIWVHDYGSSLRNYFTTEVWMPSLAMTGLHFSVLNFSSTLIVFLVQSGFSMRLIIWAEVSSATFELSSTYIFPWAVRFLSAQRTEYLPLADENDDVTSTLPSRNGCGVNDEDDNSEEYSREEQERAGVSRLGLIALALMLLCLVSTTLRLDAWVLTHSRFQPSQHYGKWQPLGLKSSSHQIPQHNNPLPGKPTASP